MMNFHRTPNVFTGNRIFFRALCIVFVLVWFASSGFAQDEENESSVEAVKIFNQAQDAHEKGDLPTALKLYEAATRINPEFPEAEYQRGNALISLGKTAEAERAFRRAVELREDWTLPMASLGSILVGADRFAEAEKILTKAVALDDKNFPAYVALADLRLKSKAAPQVLRELLNKLQNLTSKANPTASLWASRAALERVLGDIAAAKMSLSRGLAAEPTNKSALAENAEIALTEGDTASASEIAKILARLSPNSSDVKFLQARVLAAEGETFEALKVLDSVTNQSAEVVSLRNSIAANSSVNVPELEKQIEKDPKNASVLGRLCNLLRTENPLKAIDYCRRASEAEPNDLNHAVGFGAALVQAKRFENAVALLQKIRQVAPDNYTARANLATALFQLKRFPAAKTEYQWLTEKQPDLPAAYYFLAITHDNLGEYLDAMANYQQFLKLADATSDKLEIEKVNLRLPSLQKQVNKARKSEK